MADEAFRTTSASYDRIVEDYERVTSTPPPPVVAFRNRFVQSLPARAHVVDVGCGPGRDLDHFRTCGLLAVGVDASAGMATRVRERGLAVVRGDLRRPPLRRGTWHGVWSSASLLHVVPEDAASTLSEWRDLLVPGGTLALTTSLGRDDGGWEAVPYAPGSQHRGVPLRRWFTHHARGGLEQLLLSTGFTLREASVRESHRTWLEVLATNGP